MVLVAGMRWADAMQRMQGAFVVSLRTQPRTQQRADPAHHLRHSHYFARPSSLRLAGAEAAVHDES